MTTTARAPAFLKRFKCLGPECEDMCCRGWSMQLDDATYARYEAEAPVLLDAVMDEEGAGRVMRRDPASGACVKLVDGWCGIQKQYGDSMLGDACHFYPRVTRRLGGVVVMTASLSCPEIARLSLFDETPLAVDDIMMTERLPDGLRDYLPTQLNFAQALATHAVFLQAAQDSAASPEQIMLRLGSVARSLERVPVESWPQGAGVFLSLADGRIPTSIPAVENPFNLLHALCGLIVASRKTPSERLKGVLDTMERQLACSLDWQVVTIALSPASADAYRSLYTAWTSGPSEVCAPWLRRWIAMQLSVSLFPFAGPGTNLSERVTVLGVRFALLKLALMCMHANSPDRPLPELFIETVQSLSRFVDHLGDATFLLSICAETGWNREEKMRGLIEGR